MVNDHQSRVCRKSEWSSSKLLPNFIIMCTYNANHHQSYQIKILSIPTESCLMLIYAPKLYLLAFRNQDTAPVLINVSPMVVHLSCHSDRWGRWVGSEGEVRDRQTLVSKCCNTVGQNSGRSSYAIAISIGSIEPPPPTLLTATCTSSDDGPTWNSPS